MLTYWYSAWTNKITSYKEFDKLSKYQDLEI